MNIRLLWYGETAYLPAAKGRTTFLEGIVYSAALLEGVHGSVGWKRGRLKAIKAFLVMDG